MTYVIAEPCIGVKDATCVEVCPVQCIHSTPDSGQYYIDPDVCIDCEQCAVVCPVNAIFVHTELPAKWHRFIDINASFFADNKAAAATVDFATGQRMVQAAVDKAVELGASISVVIVGTAGEPISQRRMTAAPQAAEGEARANARALVASLVEPLSGGLSAPIEHEVPNQPGNTAIFAGIEVVGAISVVGATESQNMRCARAALAVYDDPSGH